MVMVMTVMVSEAAGLQRDSALAQANKIRTARRVMREQAKAGELDIGELLLDPPATLNTAEVGDVVGWAPGIGEWRTKRILNGLARANAKVSHLGDPTRRRIVERLRFYLDDQVQWNGYQPTTGDAA